ncbi:DEAD/DEAH box helicase [Pseudarthrobacter sp. IC2-21]|uniref:DEAD/DEAH box helicase n=1 Tax=Pseudarthrobacter sp. IC2-21 TaxID=3092262 RepID=UPI002A69AC4B|nr:DEAD/DEAH box helicase [Pseudarthrobacter sp. IC2-21]
MTQLAGFDALHTVVQHHIANTLGWDGLRPLQSESIGPVLGGNDCLLLAPTAGGKTEAALFPLLTRMAEEAWTGTSVLYVCPLRALLNNLEPRINSYAGWLGRTAAVRHGDTTAGTRKRQVLERPDILLTTPESLESMLVSTLADPRQLFADVRAIVVDEIHAFAGDDRGWHLLGVVERISKLAGHPLQRIGLSATVGNAPELLTWLQGSNRISEIPASVIVPDGGSPAVPEMQLDFVGSDLNAAKVIAALHRGEKRLVFADSRRTVEKVSLGLRDLEVETFVSHSSLSVDARRQAESAFSQARNCVIVSTSTLELGIDVGDLDRVVQIGAPRTVASVLQRLGRTGRRPGTERNMLFLSTDDAQFLRACGLLLLWSEGYVEPVIPPPTPLHVAAQQLLGLTLQERRIGANNWDEWFSGLGLASALEWQAIATGLVETGHLDSDQGMLFMGPEAERKYGGIHYRDLMAVFTADPQVAILHGREEIGSVDPMVLQRKVDGPRLLTLGGRAWQVNYVDWKRHRAYVEPSANAADSKWSSMPQPESYALSDATRRVLLGATPASVLLSKRAVTKMGELRDEYAHRVSGDSTVMTREPNGRLRWWTWAGARANAVLAAGLMEVAPELLDESRAFNNWQIGLRGDTTAPALSKAKQQIGLLLKDDPPSLLPQVDDRALRTLKFAELLPNSLALSTLAERNSDHVGAVEVSARSVVTV